MDAVIFRYKLAYDPPFPERKGLILYDEENQSWGEIAPLPGRSLETLEEAENQLFDVLRGKPTPSLFPSVAFGLSCMQNKRKESKKIPLCALLSGDSTQILMKAALYKKQGYTSAKLKISSLPFEEAVELIEHLRSLFYLRVDANRTFSFQDAIALFERCGASELDYIEEPTFELHRLEEFPFPFALDESLLELDTLPITPHFKTIVCKPSVTSVAKWVNSSKRIVLSSACETGIGILGIASLAASFSEILPLGLDTYRYLPQDILIPPLDFSTSNLSLAHPIQVNTDLLQAVTHV